MKALLYSLGRLLQLAGLIILPVAVAGNAADRLTLWQTLSLSAGGMAVFLAGWGLQQLGDPK
jgi:hypothetical protein